MLVMSPKKAEESRYEGKIPGNSIPAVTTPYVVEVTRQAEGRRRKYFGRKVTKEAITNAIVMHFLSLSPEERDRIIDRYIPEFEGLVVANQARQEAEFPDVVAKPVVETPKPRRKGAG